jgi:hypothetical protein
MGSFDRSQRYRLRPFATTARESVLKSDDPRLAESQKRLTERVNSLNALILEVLKNHVVVEQFMSEFLDAYGKQSGDMMFYAKMKACKDEKPDIIEEQVWMLLCKCNRLRNSLAHKMDAAEIKTNTDAVRDALVKCLSERQAAGIREMKDEIMAASALQHCGSYIVVATENKRDADKKARN